MSLYESVSAIRALEQRYGQVSHDLANANTVGYRRRQAFEELLQPSPGSLRTVAGSAVDPTPGPLQTTGSPLDAALEGPGYFMVEGRGGEKLLTRRGDFTLDGDGVLRLRTGEAVLDESGGQITLDPQQGEPRISRDGSVSQLDPVNGQPNRVGRLALRGGQALSPAGHGLLRAAQASPLAQRPRIKSGAREGSNVDPAWAMAELTVSARLFSANLSAIKQRDGLAARLLQIK